MIYIRSFFTVQKMGWKEGLGLGKANQGRTEIIEAEARSNSAGTVYTVFNKYIFSCVTTNFLKKYMRSRSQCCGTGTGTVGTVTF
jgi:hypothetical protein